ncbi:MAG: helix-turn-helix domain-containing protein [Bacteroidetes bacterium]|nr:MAG: helix-turn-helix domain-containing protein [Bacteroidota bacterium]
MSADPGNEYFSDGITEEIINALTTIQGLKVIARTSSFVFKGKNVDVRTIGRQLGVSTILEGSVRKIKNRVRITAQLISTHDGSHFWSKNFDRELADIFALQDEISLLIADQIRENFGHFEIQDHLIDAPTNNIAAYNLYLKGRYHHLRWNARDLIQGVKYYEQSIEQDPSFALPYFGAGLCYGINASWGFIPYEEGIKKAEKILKKGLRINDQSYLGYFAQATVYLWGKWDFKKGYQYLKKSIALHPSFTEAEEGLAELYTAVGAFEKAMQCTQNMLTLNPLSPNHYYTKGNIYYLSKNYKKAIGVFEKALQIDPNFALAIELIAVCYIHLKEYKKLDKFLKLHPQAEKPDACRALYKLMHADEMTDLDIASIRLKLSKGNSASLIPWHLYLNIYLGNHELALDMLEEGVKKRTGQFINFKNDPFLVPLHKYERFQHLIQTVFHPSKLPNIEKNIPTAATSDKSILTEKEVGEYLAIISDLMKNERLFLDQSLCLKSLAEQVQIHPNKLSWLLNEHIGKNFNEYINSFRLETFKEKALDPKNSHLTLLGLAYESGFNSKTAFNAFFKKMEGMTPRAWVKSNK